MRFDIDQYLRVVGPLDVGDLGDIDGAAFAADPLDPASLRCLRYMHDVEFHTTCYLRDLLVTSAHDDPEVTAFLAMWAYEEFWHGEAIARVLRAHGEAAGRERVGATRRRVGRERFKTLSMMAGSAMTDHVATVALVWGAVNEWTTQAGYLALARTSGHPVLAELVRRIARQEGRHIDFYMTQAERRLERSAAARRLARYALEHHWRPVGSGVMPAAETRHLIAHLFGDAEGASALDRVDRRMASLPGLSGLTVAASARSHLLAAPAPA